MLKRVFEQFCSNQKQWRN